MIKITKEKSLEDAYIDFMIFKNSQNLSDRTIEQYQKSYSKFIKFFSKNRLCEEITDTTISEFILYLKERNPYIKAVSINNYLRGLRTLLNYCMKKNYMPYFEVPMLKEEKLVKEIYSFEEISLLLTLPTKKDFIEYRNWVMVNYFLATGNRPRSVANIKIKDLHLEEKYLKLTTTKNKRQQLIPLEPKIVQILEEYLKIRGGSLNDFLFCNVFGEKLNENGIEQAIKNYNRNRGVERTSVKSMRDTFATLFMIYSGGNIYRVSKRLGHSDIKVTEKYISILSLIDIMTYSEKRREDVLQICYEKKEELRTICNHKKKIELENTTSSRKRKRIEMNLDLIS